MCTQMYTQSAKGQAGKGSAGLYEGAESFEKLLAGYKRSLHYIWIAFTWSRKDVFEGDKSNRLGFE